MKSKLIEVSKNLSVLDPNTFKPVEGKFKNLYQIITGDTNSMFTIKGEWSSEIPINDADEYEITISLKSVKDGTTITFE